MHAVQCEIGVTCGEHDEGSAGIDYPSGVREDDHALVAVGSSLVDTDVTICWSSRGDRATGDAYGR